MNCVNKKSLGNVRKKSIYIHIYFLSSMSTNKVTLYVPLHSSHATGPCQLLSYSTETSHNIPSNYVVKSLLIPDLTNTGFFNVKRDVLNCWCNLAFEFLVFWLSLVWSWEVEIWNFFDLSQPKCQNLKLFLLIFCPNFD